jgi:hypothetical protein
VEQLPERAPVEHPSELAGGRANPGRQRARGHHVHRPRKPLLRDHLPARVQEQRAAEARVLDEAAERLLDPPLDGRE